MFQSPDRERFLVRRVAPLLALMFVVPVAAGATEIGWRQTTKPLVISSEKFAREGTATFKDGSTAKVRLEGTLDKKKGAAANDPKAPSTFSARAMMKFEDDSTISTRYSGKIDPSSFASSGSGEIVSGTGRYKGIKGKVTFEGRVSESEWGGQYTLPKK